ncbi:hypothetical protein OU994_09925 [Pseudoduganella sp. SL102]|uniref:hypothetical protein n=1 Tax=Pseudoduganella sp. SL102 TaxID=2995154 RepID=UPI00248C763F|nr:hypothetical protein [Pseudoduganella sp. SL102]WBS05915.1 hypothetical protein OU994_09925 [Pseudoduganella sp. SL102]
MFWIISVASEEFVSWAMYHFPRAAEMKRAAVRQPLFPKGTFFNGSAYWWCLLAALIDHAY